MLVRDSRIHTLNLFHTLQRDSRSWVGTGVPPTEPSAVGSTVGSAGSTFAIVGATVGASVTGILVGSTFGTVGAYVGVFVGSYLVGYFVGTFVGYLFQPGAEWKGGYLVCPRASSLSTTSALRDG